MLRPMIRAPDISSQLKGNEDDEEILELEYKFFFEQGEEDPIYKVQIYNNLRVTEPGFFYNSKPKCEFCGLDHKDNCDFAFKNTNITFADVIKQMKSLNRPTLVLAVVWRAN